MVVFANHLYGNVHSVTRAVFKPAFQHGCERGTRDGTDSQIGDMELSPAAHVDIRSRTVNGRIEQVRRESPDEIRRRGIKRVRTLEPRVCLIEHSLCAGGGSGDILLSGTHSEVRNRSISGRSATTRTQCKTRLAKAYLLEQVLQIRSMFREGRGIAADVGVQKSCGVKVQIVVDHESEHVGSVGVDKESSHLGHAGL